MRVTAYAKQVKGILDMGGGGVGSMAIGTFALVHSSMMAQNAIGTPLMMAQVIEGYRAELPLPREDHDRRANILSKSLSTDGNQKNSQRNKDDPFHASPIGKRLKLPKHLFALHFSNFSRARQQLSGPRVRRSPVRVA
jgi:hypothetical protein